MSEVLLLCSGGLDSTTVAYWLRERGVGVVPIFFDYGQHCAEKEWATVQKVLPKDGMSRPTRIDISGIFSGSSSRLIREPDLWFDHVADEDLYVPYRTLLFFSVGASCAQTQGLTEVYSGFINSNHAKEIDCSAAFLNGLDGLAANVGPVRFKIPFRNWSKADVVREAERLKVPIGATYSCQLLSDTPCGACPNCVERLTAIEIMRTSA
ncbi:7-cyano-7-deazaguanine synthase [Mesorhizobium sp.]|uniref:7-cyano-7-deazaguanine synthase n=1 Tax=Mesorhizobium sp. TaxID=1871066 RepID=UPI000FE4F66A|nr:7-cyano-7-deazaguanine synthase [Mesorhizobium sp.]RWP94735.1 MAG: 7-cyano-7-deazaguanine synthase [Mesorhizobium sp.]RWQ45850.1 MAG: 7-cyano-7-deazaguanine synthase [Mesorhizobium sp.]